MTENEALERARFIWGETHDIMIARHTTRECSIIVDNLWHQLDQNGHAICHNQCEDLEADAEQRKHAGQRQLLEQLVREAIVLLDENEREHEILDRRDWLKTARRALSETLTTA
jgi:hypothetical protein